ncbi:MAG: polysaccharide deacetylase family protein [Bacteroidota bacterium]|nr:polysaccharide deacetylase family protein [Bacteroidota bacterium]
MTHENKIKYLYPFSATMSIQNLLKRLNSQIIFPFWHVVSDAELPHIKYLYKVQSQNEFKASLKILLQDFTPISIESLLAQDLKPNKNYMCISFDDGLVQMHDIVAPILKSMGIPGAFFINPPFVGDAQYFHRYERSAVLNQIVKTRSLKKSKQLKILNGKNTEAFDSICKSYNIDSKAIIKRERVYMNLEEIKSLHKSGFHIGAHSMTHADFSDISTDKKICEVKDSVDWIANNLNENIRSFAFPFSDDGLNYSELEMIYQATRLQLSFGTSGHGKTRDLPHYQRIPMEHSHVYPTRKILKSELFASWLKQKIKSE